MINTSKIICIIMKISWSDKTRERLFRLNQCRDDQCDQGDGLENVEHLFTSCVRTQVAWAWCRRKIMHLMPDSPTYLSNFELINLA
jgi:hypothetical protein